MELAKLFDKRILIMTGKGGVGKTTLSPAVAFAAARAGKRVCLVEVAGSPNLRYILHRQIPDYQEVMISHKLSVLTLEPFQCMEEYVRLQVKVPGAARVIMNNPIVDYFLESTPGWRELVTVGKIWHMQQETTGRPPRPLYDMIVVDAPATGHGLSFLRVPGVFANIFKFGRMQGQNKDLQAMLTDPARTAVNVVTLPEEMAVNEAVTLMETAHKDLGMARGVAFVNGVRHHAFEPEEEKAFQSLQKDKAAMQTLKGLFPDKGKALFDAALARDQRAELSGQYLDIVREKIGPPIVEIPHLHPGRVDLEGVKKIAGIIQKSVNHAS